MRLSSPDLVDTNVSGSTANPFAIELARINTIRIMIDNLPQHIAKSMDYLYADLFGNIDRLLSLPAGVPQNFLSSPTQAYRLQGAVALVLILVHNSFVDESELGESELQKASCALHFAARTGTSNGNKDFHLSVVANNVGELTRIYTAALKPEYQGTCSILAT